MWWEKRIVTIIIIIYYYYFIYFASSIAHFLIFHLLLCAVHFIQLAKRILWEWKRRKIATRQNIYMYIYGTMCKQKKKKKKAAANENFWMNEWMERSAHLFIKGDLSFCLLCAHFTLLFFCCSHFCLQKWISKHQTDVRNNQTFFSSPFAPECADDSNGKHTLKHRRISLKS